MPAYQIKQTAIENLLGKRQLLKRYQQCWEKELEQADLMPKQRLQIEADLSMIAEIDEDLLRLEQILQGRAVVPMAYNRVENEALREQIMVYLADADAIVSTTELCNAFDIDTTKLRNVMRQLRATNRIVTTRGGWRALNVMPVAGTIEAERRPQ